MTFHDFSALPAEIRQIIWRAVLPTKIRQTFHHYKIGCWQFQPFTEADEACDPDFADHPFLKYHPKFLDPVHVESPLLFTSRESRFIALGWLKEQSIPSYRLTGAQSTIFASIFRPLEDVLYVGLGSIYDFVAEATERAFAADLINKSFTSCAAPVKYIALPAIAFQDGLPSGLTAVLVDEYANVKELWILYGSLPEDEPISNADKQIKRRWHIDHAGDIAIFHRPVTGEGAEDIEPTVLSSTIPDSFVERVKAEIISSTRAWAYAQSLLDLVVRPVKCIRCS